MWTCSCMIGFIHGSIRQFIKLPILNSIMKRIQAYSAIHLRSLLLLQNCIGLHQSNNLSKLSPMKMTTNKPTKVLRNQNRRVFKTWFKAIPKVSTHCDNSWSMNSACTSITRSTYKFMELRSIWKISRDFWLDANSCFKAESCYLKYSSLSSKGTLS